MPSNMEINDPRNRGWKNLLNLKVSISGSDISDLLEWLDAQAVDYVVRDLSELFAEVEDFFNIEVHDHTLCFVARTRSCESFVSGDLWNILRDAILPDPGHTFEEEEQMVSARRKLERLEWLVTRCREDFDEAAAKFGEIP